MLNYCTYFLAINTSVIQYKNTLPFQDIPFYLYNANKYQKLWKTESILTFPW